MDIVKRACDCVPFYFPVQEPVRICDFNDLQCLVNVSDPVEYYSRDNFDTIGNNFHCFPECEHFDYPLEVALGSLAPDLKHNGLPFFTDVKLENRSLLNVFFNDLVSTKYRRDVYFNWQNILASFGGLLSLMLGFTLISGFDFMLFFLFRVPFDHFSRKITPQPPPSRPVNVMKCKVNTKNMLQQSQKRDKCTGEPVNNHNDVFYDKW